MISMSNIAEKYQYDYKYKRGTRLYIERYGYDLIEGVTGKVVTEEDIKDIYGTDIKTLRENNKYSFSSPILESSYREEEENIYLLGETIDEKLCEDNPMKALLISNIVGRILIISKEYDYKDTIKYRVINEELSNI